MHPDGVAVGALELGVDVDEALHEIVAGRQIVQMFDRRAEISLIDDRRLSWRELLDVPAEEWNARAADLQPRLAIPRAGNHHKYAASDRAGMGRGGERDLEAQTGGGRALMLGGGKTDSRDKSGDES